ncbi:hypothetical protein CHS0354_008069 [Potamilus streckersoni]|uniref:Uncharacterized protein n=1 Tax=Potamilus streckersoni TaxID=2493646 RepID=A0AAE0S879_9BIVA|nr:hypothetical protein CHS0354_008069 [Potamilus streckersoni]
MKPLVSEERSTEKEQRVQKMESVEELHSTVSSLSILKKCQMPVQRRHLPRGTERHAAFFYFKTERHWVYSTVEALDQDYGFVCDIYDLEEFHGLSLFVCFHNIFITSYKIFVIYGFERLQNRLILNEIETTMILSKRVVPIILDDCHVGKMDFFDYVDARDLVRRDIWWSKLLMELEVIGDQKPSGLLTIDEMKELVREETSTEKVQGVQKMGSDVELLSTVSGVTIPETCQMPVKRRRLPRGKKRHATFVYLKSDRDWVNTTVEALDHDYGFVCGKYDLEEFRGLSLFVCLYDIFITSCKVFAIYGFDTLQSRKILDELETTTSLSEMVVPILLDDSSIERMDFLNYVDARDSIRREIWLSNLLMELQDEALGLGNLFNTRRLAVMSLDLEVKFSR